MKKICLLILVLTLATITISAQKPIEKKKSPISFGIRAGITAPFLYDQKLTVNDVKQETPKTNTHINILTSLILRYNIHSKFYLQTEASMHYRTIENKIALNGFDISDNPFATTTFISYFETIEIPLLFGYNMIDMGKNKLSIFTGPKLLYYHSVSNEIDKNMPLKITSTNPNIGYSWVIGISTNTSGFFIDFRYEVNIKNERLQIEKTYLPDVIKPEPYIGNLQAFSTLLSISTGFIF